MPTPSRTGTASQINGSGGSSSTSVTVPSDCNLVVAFWAHWDGNGGSTLSSLTLNGVGFTVQSQRAEGSPADANGVGVATLVNPATGSQTFAWTWSAGGARSEGGEIVLVYIKDANTGDPYRAAGNDYCRLQVVDGAPSVSISSNTTDLVLGFAECYTGTNPALSGSTPFIDNAAVNSHIYDVGQITAGASSTTVTMNAVDYSCVAGISLKESTATYGKPYLRSRKSMTFRR